MKNRTILGVDFSGAVLAGEKIWVSRAQWDGEKLVFDVLERATQLPDGGAEREVALTALRQWILRHENAACGLDFPFSLHHDELGDESYGEWLSHLPDRFTDTETFRTTYAGERRRTDIAAKTPFSPLNLRLYRQTYYGLREILAPLQAAGARLLPFDAPQDDTLWLMEICPASLLKKEKLYLSYKGKSVAQRENRETIAYELALRIPFSWSDELKQRAMEDTEGDALDAVLAGICTHQALQEPAKLAATDEVEKKEGRVYF